MMTLLPPEAEGLVYTMYCSYSGLLVRSSIPFKSPQTLDFLSLHFSPFIARRAISLGTSITRATPTTIPSTTTIAIIKVLYLIHNLSNQFGFFSFSSVVVVIFV